MTIHGLKPTADFSPGSTRSQQVDLGIDAMTVLPHGAKLSELRAGRFRLRGDSWSRSDDSAQLVDVANVLHLTLQIGQRPSGSLEQVGDGSSSGDSSRGCDPLAFGCERILLRALGEFVEKGVSHFVGPFRKMGIRI
ncbi:MAG: hypothetical protein ACKV2Q_24115 [Planctomycetaceae bacterium]